MVKRSVTGSSGRNSDRAKGKSSTPKTTVKEPVKSAESDKARKVANTTSVVTNPSAKKAAKKTAKKVEAKKAARPSDAGARSAGGEGKSAAVVYEQVKGWNVVDVTDGIAVHDSQFSGVHYLNHTAAAIYLLCSEPISVQMMSTIMREEFGLTRDPESEVTTTLEQMIRIGLIRQC